MKNKKRYLIIMMLIVLVLGLSSISYARDITVDENIGTQSNPITINLNEYETVVHYGSTNLPFYFKVQNNGSNIIGLYKVALDQRKKTVTFTLNSAKKSVGSVGNSYGVTPGDRNTSVNYFQAGAILDDEGIGSVSVYPVYLIKEIQTYSGGLIGVARWSKTTTLGNAYDSIANGIDTKTYVFSATNTPINKLMAQSNRQANEGITPKLDNQSSITYTGTETPDITYAFYGVSSEVLDNNATSSIERTITTVGLAIGDVCMYLIRKIPGGWLSVDTIIFNQYKPTVVDFFNTSSSSGLYTSSMQTVINYWFSVFSTFAKVILLMALPVIGIRAMLSAGTPKQRSLPNLLSGWVIAIAFLYFGPYIMKYIIQINDAIVTTLRGQSKYSMSTVYNYDFMDKYQMGEDSETSMLEKLNKIKKQVSEEAQEQYDKMMQAKAEYEEKLQASKTSLGTTMQIDKLTAGIKKAIEDNINSGGPYKRFSDSEIAAMVERGQFLKLGATTTTTTVGLSLNIDMAIKQAENFVKNTGVDPKDIQIYFNIPTQNQSGLGSTSLPNLPGNTTGLPTLPSATLKNVNIPATEVTEAFSNYLQEKALYDEKMQTLEDIEKAIEIEQKGLDLMGVMRERAGQTKRLVYLVIWFLLIYQMLMILFLYYKRLITLAVLIAIFPLSVMMYGIEKAMGVEKPKSIHTWMVEYLVNVFIQSVHALLYVTLVEGGLSIYEQDPDNWLLFVFAVFALIPMESIVKAIIGLKAASVLGLKNYSGDTVAKTKAAKDTTKVGKDVSKQIDDKQKAKENRAMQKQKRHDVNAERKKNNAIVKAMKKGKTSADIKKINDKYDRRSKRLNGASGEGGLRGFNRKRRKITGYAKKAIFKGRNIAATAGVFSTGVATGGDFSKGVAVATAIAGTKGKSTGSVSTPSKPKATSSNGIATGRTPTTGGNSRNTAQQPTSTQGGGGTFSGTYQNTQPQTNTTNASNASNSNSNARTAEQLNNYERVSDAFSSGLSRRNVKNNENWTYNEK